MGVIGGEDTAAHREGFTVAGFGGGVIAAALLDKAEVVEVCGIILVVQFRVRDHIPRRRRVLKSGCQGRGALLENLRV